MASVRKVEPPPAPPVQYLLTLNQEEFDWLKELIGDRAFTPYGPQRDIFDALDRVK